ncbi:hypothetical protein Pmar_PMAR028672 [Perkinsus marinus ATCC 50983]|uniref:Uncharacterized protein n=1 Tax=Perkinsus marinus (strain ATCC 50983 / TXsc) TaxID=423536 RepID=C5K8K0_PERM5|nr:hypothetical protein Pmar_PMAR028672 [Perkinsus marinus ATCC 50983]EER19207.1 hypothetical protein Pmar_PMAR028672 [Perkinsus marinus ATCC 50983]|eukprot:XP_002787411.1 hypothetical protein Pmar_PMAR028672 [Perkinsus marinus ATCC 50983]
MAPTYESLSQSLRRSINCLVDGDRRLRTEGIITIKKGIETAVYQEIDKEGLTYDQAKMRYQLYRGCTMRTSISH